MKRDGAKDVALNVAVWSFVLIGCLFFWYVVIAFTLGAL